MKCKKLWVIVQFVPGMRLYGFDLVWRCAMCGTELACGATGSWGRITLLTHARNLLNPSPGTNRYAPLSTRVGMLLRLHVVSRRLCRYGITRYAISVPHIA
eukprot:2392426-Rhodomonas_salina.1